MSHVCRRDRSTSQLQFLSCRWSTRRPRSSRLELIAAQLSPWPAVRSTGARESARERRLTVQNDNVVRRRRRGAAELAAENPRRPPAATDADEGTFRTACCSVRCFALVTSFCLCSSPSVVTPFSLLFPNFLRVAILLDYRSRHRLSYCDYFLEP